MKPTFSILFVFLAAPLLAQQSQEIKRIFDDINFISYQLTLDTKGQYQLASNSQSLPAGKNAKSRAKSQGTPGPNPTEAPPVSRVFKAQNIWADLNVAVLDYGSRMELQIRSSKPAQGWMLQQGDSNHILFRGNVENNALNFQVAIPRQYSADLGLTVIVTGPDGQNPAFIALK
jgi:hypothetical protein